MPPRKGNERVDISLPSELVERLTVLASQPGASRSSVLEQCLRAHLEGSASQTLLEGLHQRQDGVAAGLARLDQTLGRLELRLKQVEDRTDTLLSRVDALGKALARPQAAPPPEKGGFWSRVNDGRR